MTERGARVEFELSDDALDRLADRLADRLRDRLDRDREDGWLDTRGAADYLGISKHALHRLTASREIPFSQSARGARCWFRRGDLDTWRESQAI